MDKYQSIHLIDKSVISEVDEILNSIKTIEIDRKSSIFNSDFSEKYFQELSSLNNWFLDIFSGIQGEVQKENKMHLKSILLKNISKQSVEHIGIKIIAQNWEESALVNLNLTPSISTEYWDKIKGNVLSSTKYHGIKNRLRKYFQNIISQKIELELSKIPFDILPEIKAEFIKEFRLKPLTFEEFLTQKEFRAKTLSKSEQNETQERLTEQMREDFKKSLDKKKLDIEKQKQNDSFDNYQNYFNMDERQLEQAKRTGKIKKRKYTKQSRRGKYQK